LIGAGPLTIGASAAAGFRSDTTHEPKRNKDANRQQQNPRSGGRLHALVGRRFILFLTQQHPEFPYSGGEPYSFDPSYEAKVNIQKRRNSEQRI
jgi:hypothetical protein